MKFETKLGGDDAEKLCEIVDVFAEDMKERLLFKLNVQGFDGWDLEHERKQMAKRMAKKSVLENPDNRKEKDFIDIANFAMFLWNMIDEK